MGLCLLVLMRKQNISYLGIHLCNFYLPDGENEAPDLKPQGTGLADWVSYACAVRDTRWRHLVKDGALSSTLHIGEGVWKTACRPLFFLSQAMWVQLCPLTKPLQWLCSLLAPALPLS